MIVAELIKELQKMSPNKTVIFMHEEDDGRWYSEHEFMSVYESEKVVVLS